MQDPKVKILENFVNEIDKNRDKVWGVPVSHISKKKWISSIRILC